MTGGIFGQASTPSLGGIFAGTPPSQQGLGIFGQQPQQQQQQQQMVPAQPLGENTPLIACCVQCVLLTDTMPALLKMNS
jgi:hypothetical protein